MRGRRIYNRGGIALNGISLIVGGNAFFSDGFRAGGSGKEEAILRLSSARITGGLSLLDARIRCGGKEPALDLEGASAGSALLDPGLLWSGGEVDKPESWHAGAGATVELDGFVYSMLDSGQPDPGPDTHATAILLDWIRKHSAAYAAQPYQRLAAYHRGSGHETEARGVLIAQQHDALTRKAITGRFPRLRHRLFGLLLGYGYQAWRSVVALAGVVALACGLGLTAGNTPTARGTYAATRPDRTACSAIEQVGTGLERGLPVINTGIRERCDFDTAPVSGQIYAAAGWALQVAAWALATLLIAGSTGLVRKPQGSADVP